MTESNFNALNIRLGDRRKLQRELARRQLWPENSPLPNNPDELRAFTHALLLRDGMGGAAVVEEKEVVKNGFRQRVSERSLGSEEGMSPDVGEKRRRSSVGFFSSTTNHHILMQCATIDLPTYHASQKTPNPERDLDFSILRHDSTAGPRRPTC